MSARARDIMTRDVLTVKSDACLADLARTLVDAGVSGAAVTGVDGEIVGVVTRADLVHARAHDEVPRAVFYHQHQKLARAPATEGLTMDAMDEFDEDEIETAEEEGLTVADIMNPNIYSIDETEDVYRVAAAMDRLGVHRLLVTQGGRFVGVVSSMDLVRFMARRGPRDEAPP